MKSIGDIKNVNIHIWSSAIFLFILILDQITKHFISLFIQPYRHQKIIPGLFNLVYVTNKGGAFGIFSNISGVVRGVIFISFSIITILVLVAIYFKSEKEPVTRLGIAFLMGGALGNLIDRLRFGEVIDFLDFYLKKYHWPAFNIADMAICIGLGFLLWDLLVTPILCHQK